MFRFVSVCFETVLFVSVVSIYVRNTETTQTNRNTTETDLVSVCFGSNRNFVCVEETLIATLTPVFQIRIWYSYFLGLPDPNPDLLLFV